MRNDEYLICVLQIILCLQEWTQDMLVCYNLQDVAIADKIFKARAHHLPSMTQLVKEDIDKWQELSTRIYKNALPLYSHCYMLQI